MFSIKKPNTWEYMITIKKEGVTLDLNHPKLSEVVSYKSKVGDAIIVSSKVSDSEIERLISEIYNLSSSDYTVTTARKYYNVFSK